MPDSIGPYQVLRRLGTGGMGEVYLAHDPRLQRQVALKRPSDEWLASSEGSDRLRREARAAARLTHTNIAAIYDVIDVDGRPYIVMEYVEGQSLIERIRHGPLAAERVIDIGLQLADALVDAHANGVVHRDLKPGNIVLTPSGRVKILDFGIARVSDAGPSSSGTATESGRMVGTPGYMAPEQVLGQRADERSDIYAVGVVLFELATGQPLFADAEPMARALATVAQTTAPRANEIVRAVPAALAEVIARAMARNAVDRFRDAIELRTALTRVQSSLAERPTLQDQPAIAAPPRRGARRPWIVGAIVASLLVIAAIVWRPWTPGRAGATAPSVVAVLPLVVDQQDADLAAVAAGLGEMIVNELAADDLVTAIPRSATVAFEGSSADIRRVADTLHADFVVTGDLRRGDGGVNLTLRLTPAGAGGAWEKTYKASEQDLVATSNTALADLARRLGASRVPASPVRWEAFQQYSQARNFLDRRDVTGNIERAISLLESAVKLEPKFALAHASLGEAFWQKYRLTRDRSLVDRARDETMVALSIDPAQPLVRLTLATIFQGTGQAARAEQELREVIAKDPLDSAHRLLGQILADTGRGDEALVELQKAIDLRPGTASNYLTKGVALLKMGRYPDAEAVLLRAAEVQPDHADVYQYLGTTYLLMGQPDRAFPQFRRSLDLAPKAEAWSNFATVLYENNRPADALDAFQHAAALGPRDPKLRRNLGDMLQRLNRTREARQAFTQCADLAEEALRVNPSSFDTHGILAICQAKLGRFADAIGHVDRAVEISPKTAEVYHRRAAVLALAGRSREAIAALTQAFAYGYTAARVTRDEDLRSIRDAPEFKALLSKNR